MSHPGTVPHVTANIPLPSHAEVENIVNQMLDNLKEDMMYSKLKMRFDQLNLYLGSEEQLPNSKMEEYWASATCRRSAAPATSSCATCSWRISATASRPSPWRW